MLSAKSFRKTFALVCPHVCGSVFGLGYDNHGVCVTNEEQTLKDLEQRVLEAQEDLLRIVRGDPEKWWDARDLRQAAVNGLSGEIMMFALTDLVNQDKLDLDGRLRVRAMDDHS
jgi:hypothetical protein